MANSNDVKKMVAFFKLQKDSMVEYYKNINYLISLGNQFKINDPQLQVIWDRLKKVYPAVIEKNPDFRLGLPSGVSFFSWFFEFFLYTEMKWGWLWIWWKESVILDSHCSMIAEHKIDQTKNANSAKSLLARAELVKAYA